MSFRMKGLLADQYQSRVEHSYLRLDNVITLENVPCEMVFSSSSGFIEHESAKHNYLPVFHLMGCITEIKGDFPYHVSSLYFDESQKAAMSRDIVYYPSPDELAHMIQKGKFFSKQFDIPMVLNRNVYNFPAVVNLTVVPPENEAAYEASVLDRSGDFEALDKTNLPIIYVGICGTGVSRKTDPLLDYYGIELDADFSSFVLTAESSGYVDPPLMGYIEEPVVEEEHQRMLNKDDYFLSEEDQRQLITAKKEEVLTPDVDRDLAADYHGVSAEDVLVAKATRNIAKRVEQRVVANQQELQQRLAEVRAEQRKNETEVKSEPDKSDKKDVIRESVSDMIRSSPRDDYEDQRHPDIMQQQSEVQMDLNSEQNQTVLDERSEDGTDSGTEEVQESDAFDLENMQGADVADVEDQAKVDEARVRDLSRNAAIAQQTDAVEEDEVGHAASDDHTEHTDDGSHLSRSEMAKLNESEFITSSPDNSAELDL